MRSGDRWDHTKSFLLNIILPLNISSSFLMVSFAVWGCRTVLLKPLRFKMHILLTLQQSTKEVQCPSISYLSNLISRVMFFKSHWTNYPVCTDSAQCCTFNTVKWTRIDFIRRFNTPCPAVLWIDVSIHLKVGFNTEPNVVYLCIIIVHFSSWKCKHISIRTALSDRLSCLPLCILYGWT